MVGRCVHKSIISPTAESRGLHLTGLPNQAIIIPQSFKEFPVFKKVTPTEVITTGLNAYIGYVLGVFALGVLITLSMYMHDWYQGYQRVDALQGVQSGRLHHVYAMDERGGTHGCYILTTSTNMTVEDINSSSDFCYNRVARHANDWKSYADQDHSSVFWPIVLSLVVIGAVLFSVWLVTHVVVQAILFYVVPSFFEAWRFISYVILVPFFLFTVVMLTGIWDTHPTTWTTPGKPLSVDTEAVFVDNNRNMYQPPVS